MNTALNSHIVQSKEWGDFKTQYGTKSVRVGEVQYSVHKIPFTQSYYAYCPKVDPFKINFEVIKKSLEENNCLAINFDVPNILRGSSQESSAKNIFEPSCVLAHKETFARHNILLDISKPEEELLKNMHNKHQYNLRYSLKKGVTVRRAENETDFDVFFNLLDSTATRQKYFIHPKHYYNLIWDVFHPLGKAEILMAYFENTPLASWMVFIHDGVVYYPYGGSSEEHKNLFASTQVCWEVIKLGKSRGCTLFDMWGAADSLENTADPWYGFTNFKLKFGGDYVEYMDSYDFVLNPGMYGLFNVANDVRWGLLRVLK